MIWNLEKASKMGTGLEEEKEPVLLVSSNMTYFIREVFHGFKSLHVRDKVN